MIKDLISRTVSAGSELRGPVGRFFQAVESDHRLTTTPVPYANMERARVLIDKGTIRGLSRFSIEDAAKRIALAELVKGIDIHAAPRLMVIGKREDVFAEQASRAFRFQGMSPVIETFRPSDIFDGGVFTPQAFNGIVLLGTLGNLSVEGQHTVLELAQKSLFNSASTLVVLDKAQLEQGADRSFFRQAKTEYQPLSRRGYHAGLRVRSMQAGVGSHVWRFTKG